MNTSGTVATTVIDTASIIEHAFRRCRVLPSAQTPETVLIAQECLYMLMLNLGNRGLNLWAVDKVFVGLKAGQATYETPAGTLDVLNVIFTKPHLETVVFTAQSDGGEVSLTSANIQRVGFSVSATFTGALTVKTSSDGATFTDAVTLNSATYLAGQYYWADLPVVEPIVGIQVVSDSASYPAVTDIKCVSGVYDLPCSQWNRDTYAALNNKTQPGSPSTSYFFEKKLTPTVTLWPVPTNSDDHITLYRHRQSQDVGALNQQLEIPQRWLDGIIWLLAARLCFELPKVDPAVIQMVLPMADKQVFEAEGSETDGAPIYIAPRIGVYSR